MLPAVLDIEHLILPVPSYSEYQNSSDKIETTFVNLKEDSDFELNIDILQNTLDSIKGKTLVYLGQPNNPTGKLIPKDSITKIAQKNSKIFFCIDESFSDFISGYSSIAKEQIPNIIVIKSLTKFYGIPGLRLGMCIGSSDVIKKIKNKQSPWSVNILAYKIGEKIFQDKLFIKESITDLNNFKKQLTEALSHFKWLKIYPGEVNFILIRIIDHKIKSQDLYSYLENNGFVVRNCENFKGLDNSFFRIAVRRHHENMAFIDCLKSYSDNNKPRKKDPTGTEQYNFKKNRSRSVKSHPLMIQGTASNAGKSILAAGLCRIFYQDGYNVAPFKAQNMSNNSAVTIDGKEMGRAQALQAKACNLTPDVRMNPVLLKPSSDNQSQIIINGIAKGNMTVKNWKSFKTGIIKEVKASYDSLSSEYDVVILEGAGSPGEVNLKDNDIVNMGMARYANSPVLIAGDIDRGGVYASLIGTMDVFEEWERDLVKGFIINRFRGNSDLLKEAHDYIFDYTGKEIMGTIPFINNLNLPEEDSVSLKNGLYFTATKTKSSLKIALIDLPHISNFTDFDPLRIEADIEIKLIRESELLDSSFSAVIIPGSKNTADDLKWLKKRGFQSKLIQIEKEGVEIVGICGGFQMLGLSISDHDHIETVSTKKESSINGLGMLDIETSFYSDKQLKQRESIHIPSGCKVRGYEIHHGRSSLIRGKIIISSEDDLLGVSSNNGHVWGTYLHGIFDDDNFRLWFLNSLRKNQGLSLADNPSYTYDIDKSLDRLADILRENLDLDKIKTIMGL